MPNNSYTQATAMFTSLIGMIAATLTTVAYVPQVHQTWKSRSAKGLSLPMLLLFSTGVTLWLVYGVRTASWPVILANAATLLLTLVLLVLKFRYKS